MSDTPPTPITYKTVLEQGGLEGPYTVDELRELLILGRVRSSDRLMESASHKITTVKTVIEDAGRISELRPALREQALQEKQRHLEEAQAQATAPTVNAPPEDSAVAEFQRRAALQKKRTKHFAVIGLGLTACSIVMVYVAMNIDFSAPTTDSATMAVNIKIFGTWIVRNSGGTPAFDAAQITLTQKTLIIARKDSPVETLAIKNFSSFGPGFASIHFESAHPVLGSQVALMLTSESLRISYSRLTLDCVAAAEIK